jgi:putative transposase
MSYLTALAQNDLSGHLDYVTRNLIKKWFQTLTVGVERFHNAWTSSRANTQRWLAAFAFYYNFQRLNQALDNRTPVEEVANP